MAIPRALQPVTPLSCGRYDDRPGAQLSHQVVAPGLFTRALTPEPPYLPLYWSAHVHPEGQLYFYRQSPLRVVTEAYVYDSAVLGKVVHWSSVVEARLDEENIKISDDIELFLRIMDENCTYYLVDYSSKTVFWLDEMSTEDLGLWGALSQAHLKLHLQSLFWRHIEHFPMHSGALPLESVDELFSIYSHGLADKITSLSSTFFNDKQDCQDFLKLLKTSRDFLDDGHQICLIARLWTTIYDHRFAVNYGTQHCRLDRNTSVLWADPEEVAWLSAILSRLSFGTYDVHLARLRDLFCDRFVYLEQWQPFISQNLQEWRDVSHRAFASLMLHLFPLLVPSSAVLGIISFGLSSASLLTSVFLIHRYKAMQGAAASTARDHLANVESTRFGFQFVAFASALPSTLWLWGLGLFFVNCFYTLGHLFGLAVSLIVFFCCTLALLAFQRATSESHISCAFSIPSFFRRRQASEDMV